MPIVIIPIKFYHKPHGFQLYHFIPSFFVSLCNHMKNSVEWALYKSLILNLERGIYEPVNNGKHKQKLYRSNAFNK